MKIGVCYQNLSIRMIIHGKNPLAKRQDSRVYNRIGIIKGVVVALSIPPNVINIVYNLCVCVWGYTYKL